MKRLLNMVLLLVFVLLTGCQKSIGDEDNENGNNGGTGADGATAVITPEMKASALTIAQAQLLADGTPVCVKGYIVASCERSISNADYTSPFEGTTAIVLADKPSNADDNQFETNELFPICLTDAASGIRTSFNLAANPQYWNQYVYIYGTKDGYMSLNGMKKVKAIEVDATHIDDGGNGNENGDDNGNEDPDNDGPGDDIPDPSNPGDENPDMDDGGQQGSSVLTVAQAKEKKEGDKIKVQGYIVAALSSSKDYISFDYPEFNGYRTAIVLADNPYTPTNPFDTDNYSDLFIVYFGDSQARFKKELNLVDNYQNWNKRIQINGTVGFYYGTKLLLVIDDYTLIEMR